MCRLLPVLLVAAILPAGGCKKKVSVAPAPAAAVAPTAVRAEKTFRKKAGGPTTPEQDAVYRALDDDREHFRQVTDGLRSDAQPSQLAQGLERYHDHLMKTDLGTAPAEFRAAFGRYRTAVGGLHKALARLPDHFEEAAFLQAYFDLARGDSNRSKRLGGDVVKAVRDLNAALAEVYAAAEGYGIELDK